MQFLFKNFYFKIILMKKLLFILFVLFVCSPVFAQFDNWATIDYTYSKGPVSPEYQLTYQIILDKSGNGKLIYSKASVTSEYDFKASKKSMKNLNKKLKKSEVFSVPSDEMKAADNMIGGPTRSMQIIMWQSPDLDQKPVVIDVASHLNEAYSNNVFIVYEQLENMVPKSIWDKAAGN